MLTASEEVIDNLTKDIFKNWFIRTDKYILPEKQYFEKTH